MFTFSSVRDYHSNLLNGQTTCVEAVLFYIQQIEQQQKLNAFIEVYKDEALAKAHQLDADRAAGKAIGKLHGVVTGLKDVIAYKGHSLTAGSEILSGFESIYNASAVEKLLAEDAIIIGRQNCDEFAMGSSNENSAYGKVLNAADHSKVPGGSSGGSAVAVQAGLCMLSLGSDTGGSVRQPADFCGVIGFKPTYGRISRYGLIAYASSFDQIGIFGNNVHDIELMLSVIEGADDFDSTTFNDIAPADEDVMQPQKFAYFRQALESEGLDGEIAGNFKDYIRQLEHQGHTVEAIDFDLLDLLVPVYYILTTAEASSNLGRYDGIRYGYSHKNPEDLFSLYSKSRSEGFGKEVKRRILLGTFVLSEGYHDAYFTKAQQVRRLLINKTKEIFRSYNFIISPTSPTTAFPFGLNSNDPVQMFLADIYTVYANLAGIPAISLPVFKHSNGMPFGLQVMAKAKNDLSLLRISETLMPQFENSRC